MPEWHQKADPSWFAFPLSIREHAPFSRYELTKYLELQNIETRLLFAGNILSQPAYQEIDSRAIGDLAVSDQIMKGSFFVGVYPGLDANRLDYMIDMFGRFIDAYL
jgi:CDP-6-deoxy-D-xylo-4-hexulose-3-dehydrase